MSERNLTEDDVRVEHMQEVRPLAEWIYMAAVVLGGLIAMLVFIAWLGGGTGS